jgi:general stress protein 26
MTTPHDLETKFWKALKHDRTVMLGVNGVEDGHTQPMTAVTEEEGHGPLWIFTASDAGLAVALGEGDRAIASFVSKDHDLFATLHGSLTVDNDQATINRLWNPMIAAWYKGGKTDPKLTLLRFDLEEAQIWENSNTLVAGLKMLVGVDPRKAHEDKVATVAIG